MAQEAPGKHYRKGITLLEVANMFGDEEKARGWIAEQRWPNGPYCPHCGSVNVQSNIKHKTMTHRCRDCDGKPMFSIKTGTVMEGSNLKYRVWAVGVYLFTTNIKGISSMKLHRELGIGQKAAWFMLHRLRKVFEAEVGPFAGLVEVDETFIGGKEKNKARPQEAEGGSGHRRQDDRCWCQGPRDEPRERRRGGGNGRQNTSRLRRLSCSGRRDGLHRRPHRISGNAV